MKWKNWDKVADRKNHHVWKHEETNMTVELKSKGVKRYVTIDGVMTGERSFTFSEWGNAKSVAHALLDAINGAYVAEEYADEWQLPINIEVGYDEDDRIRSHTGVYLEFDYMGGDFITPEDVEMASDEFLRKALNYGSTKHDIHVEQKAYVTTRSPMDVDEHEVTSAARTAMRRIERKHETTKDNRAGAWL